MKRKFLVVLLAVITALCMAFGFAGCSFSDLFGSKETGYSENGLFFMLNADGESYAVSRGAFNGSALVIPETFHDAPVTSIKDFAFRGCSGLTSIAIPDGVTSIGRSAFSGCSGLKKVHIFDLAAWCRIDFDYIYTNPLYYAHHLYLDGAELKDLTIPSEITEIKDYAFEGCSGLNSVTIGGGVTSIGRKAFGCCSGLTSMEIPDSVTSIGKEAFGCCSGLTEIKVNENNPIYHSDGNCLIETGSKTLILGCNTSKIPDDGSATLIGNSAFYGCSGLTSIEIPDSVTSIGEVAFLGCDGLESVTIGSGVTSIGDSAFQGCNGLESMTIGSGVTSIGNSAFSWCSRLKEVHISDLAAWCRIDFSDSSANPLYYAHHLYLDGAELKDLTIPAEIKAIKAYAFYDCDGLTSIEIPDSVTEIERDAFYNCDGLTLIVIPDSVTSIEYSAFYHCSRLKSVMIGSGVTFIGEKVFWYCDNLQIAIFDDPSNWYYNYELMQGLKDPARAAQLLRENYSYAWEKRN